MKLENQKAEEVRKTADIAKAEKEKEEELELELSRQCEEQLRQLAREYPELDELPVEVLDALLDGEEPRMAYLAYENRQLRKNLAAAERDRENQKKAFGSALGNAEGGESDPFLCGFDKMFRV